MENEMGITTVWALEHDGFNECDAKWCKGLGVEVKIDSLYNHFYTATGSHSYVTGLSIRIKTTSEKQETMLKLKYSHRLIEVQRSVTLSYNECKELKF